VLGYIRALEDREWRAAASHPLAVSALSGLPTPTPAGGSENEEFRSDREEEESQLSQQLQDTALSQDSPLPLLPLSAVQGARNPVAAGNAARSEREKETTTTTAEHSWAYDAAFLSDLSETSMSALLLRRLDSIVACEGETSSIRAIVWELTKFHLCRVRVDAEFLFVTFLCTFLPDQQG
jgi:hypothetical protein